MIESDLITRSRIRAKFIYHICTELYTDKPSDIKIRHSEVFATTRPITPFPDKIDGVCDYEVVLTYIYSQLDKSITDKFDIDDFSVTSLTLLTAA